MGTHLLSLCTEICCRRSPGADVPIVSLALTLAAVLASGFPWTWSATALALRDPLLAVLRNE